MKQFSLDEYLKNPERKIVTRDGRNVRIIYTDARGSFPIVALIETPNEVRDMIYVYTKDGYYFEIGSPYRNDLFFAPEKKEGWINIYSGSYFSTSSRIFSSEEEAKKEGEKWKDYVTTIKIEWEEEV